MPIRRLVCLVILSLALPLYAQTPAPALPQLTWIRFFSVEPGQEEQFVSYLRGAGGGAVFDRLINDGKLASWGIAVPMVMSGQDYTHAVWITMNNWATGDAVMQAFENANKAMSASDRQKDMKAYMSMVKKTPYDVVIRHQVQSAVAPSPNYKLNYVRLSMSEVKPGRGADRVAMYREATVPLFTDLQTRGVIGPWGLSTQEVGSQDWTHMSWVFIDDLASLDELRDGAMATPESVRTERGARLRDMIDPAKNSTEILRVVHTATPRPRS